MAEEPEDRKATAPDHNRIEAEPEGYTPIDGDIYRTAVPVQFTEAQHSGEPQAHEPEPEELPTTNAHEDGGLPTDPREPYPTGNPDRTFDQRNGVR